MVLLCSLAKSSSYTDRGETLGIRWARRAEFLGPIFSLGPMRDEMGSLDMCGEGFLKLWVLNTKLGSHPSLTLHPLRR